MVTVGDLLLVGEWLVYSEPVGLFELFYPLFFSLFLEVGAGLIVGLFVLLTLFGLQPFPIQVGRYVVVGVYVIVGEGLFDGVSDLRIVGEWLVDGEPVGLFELFFPLFFSLFLEVGAGLIVGLFVLLTLFGLQPFPIQVGRYVVVGE